MSSSYRKSLEDWLTQLDVKADRVLDIGGAQLPVKGRTKSWDVKEYLIADLPNPHVGSPKPDIELDLNSFDSGIGMGDKYYEYFDVVFCLEVFEYVWNTYFAFEEIAIRLKKGGTAWVTFPSFYPHHQPIEDDSLRYMKGGIVKLAEASGLKIADIIPRRPETRALLNFFSHERLRAAKGFDHDVMGYIVRFTK